MTTFQVVCVSMAYNVILGRPLLNKIKVIVSTFYLAMKFSISNGVVVVHGDQTAARQCYVASIREINNDVMQISRMDPEDGQQVKLAPVEELMEIELEHNKKVTIGRDLDATLKTKLIGCLSRNINILAWKVEDMSGIDPKIAVHKLNISPGARPVKQKKRQFAYQILVAEEDQEKKSFMADSVIYYYKVMPFGLKNAGATYQRLINKVFANLIERNVEVYTDDMVVKSKQMDQHISDLEEVFDTLRKYRMKLNPAKCAFGVASGKFLGFMITHRGIEANPDKIQALASMESPRNKKEVQRLTGMIAALNRFTSRVSDRCYPFFKVLRGTQGFGWSEDCEKAFQELKQTLASLPILTRPEPGDTLFLYLVVSQKAVSRVLVKEVNRVQQPIYYVSKVLLDAETRYTLAEQLALALVIVARKFRQYFQSHPIVVLTNQPLRHILQKSDVSGRLMKWAIKLGEFDIEFKSCPSIKAQALADFIAELTPRPRGLGVIIINPDKHTEIQCTLRFEFEETNNEAEYEAVVIALELDLSLELEFVKVFSDSQLVVGQIEGSFERKDEKMSLYCMKVRDLQRKFKSCEIAKVARKDNGKADALSRLVFMGIDCLDRTVHIKVITKPSINQIPDVMDIDNEPSSMEPIIEFITSGNLPSDARLARSIRARAPRYCMISGVLFRRSITLPYLRCLRPSESSQALAEVREGVCGNHQGARALSYKLIRYGYYWPTMKKDASEYVKRCDRCQRFGNVIHSPAEDLTNINCSAPFEQWGVDILGPFPVARGQLKFVAVAVEYFTKWAEAEPLTTISEPKLRAFTWRSIICRFGIPKVLITNNDRQFDNQQFRDFCSNLGIDHCLTSVSHPQSNGLAEVTNRITL
ncbi:uncharacterized protein LOC111379372 [Olea europaea var. sylvestris]|uniref:uncharacterized protein LOC111379372 n=1 Tax=Olea europaea var. sylvestris TaxID=158386 RepID=UPI000C1CD4AD|nr:uncharacterized protein LOC111379372 [Olea europaea var. sylvestris]